MRVRGRCDTAEIFIEFIILYKEEGGQTSNTSYTTLACQNWTYVHKSSWASAQSVRAHSSHIKWFWEYSKYADSWVFSVFTQQKKHFHTWTWRQRRRWFTTSKFQLLCTMYIFVSDLIHGNLFIVKSKLVFSLSLFLSRIDSILFALWTLNQQCDIWHFVVLSSFFLVHEKHARRSHINLTWEASVLVNVQQFPEEANTWQMSKLAKIFALCEQLNPAVFRHRLL